ncbi:MAG: hypothetical protein KTR22_07470 [Flavobacteriaceae bacterium]|nr:hypothetical protein [Flavobacteriaceae bacterium]
MTFDAAFDIYESHIKLMELIEFSPISYSAVVKVPNVEGGFGVEYGDFTRKIGVFTKKDIIDQYQYEIRTKGIPEPPQLTQFDEQIINTLFENFKDLNPKRTDNNVGRFLNESNELKERIRPIKGGTSICEEVSVFKSGTLGGLLKFKEDPNIYGISNMHVLSSYLSNRERPDILITADHQKVYQPSRHDGKALNYRIQNEETIGETVWKDMDPFVDAAILKLDEGVQHTSGLFNYTDKLDPKNISKYSVGDLCTKIGRSTRITHGDILSEHAAIRLDNPFHRINDLPRKIVFRDQIMTNNVADEGDSGSLLIANEMVAGLTFADINFDGKPRYIAGNLSKKSGRTFHNKITNVLDRIMIQGDEGMYPPKFEQFIF